ncbi:MAG: sorbosone dehydrogenase family protein [Bacteroidia bacterium]
MKNQILLISFLVPLFFVFSCKNNNGDKSTDNNDTTATRQTPSREIQTDLPLDDIKLPEGFRITLFAQDVENARSMVRGDDGTVYVGSRSAGKVYALPDADGDFVADEVVVIASGLNSPNGVALKDGNLYVALIDRILQFPAITNTYRNEPKPETVFSDYPDKTHHGWKYIAFGPDGMLYVPVGAPCNICLSEDPIFASITRLDVNNPEPEIYAEGIRNTVGFAWHPETKELWFTDNGRDMMGDNIPPDKLNHAPEKGMHFGYPFCHGTDIPDPEFGDQRNCNEFTPPVQNLGPHVAALGMKFYTGKMFPEEYRNKILIAEHGSWNRSTPIGYRIMMVTLDGNRATEYEPFAEGWLNEGKDWGRPVDIIQMPDGAILISDDKADAIYRIVYEGNNK